jgi:hypothetical protein
MYCGVEWREKLKCRTRGSKAWAYRASGGDWEVEWELEERAQKIRREREAAFRPISWVIQERSFYTVKCETEPDYGEEKLSRGWSSERSPYLGGWDKEPFTAAKNRRLCIVQALMERRAEAKADDEDYGHFRREYRIVQAGK